MPERTFYAKWSRMKRERTRPGSTYTGATLLDYLRLELARSDGLAGPPEELAKGTGLSLRIVRECLAMQAQAGEGGPTVADQIAARKAAARSAA